MLNLRFQPHRNSLKANTAETQKLFVMLKMIPQAEVAKTRPNLAIALVIDTSSSMNLYADQKQAELEIQRRNLSQRQQSSSDGNYQAVNLNLPTKIEQAVTATQTLINDKRLLTQDKLTIIDFNDEAKTVFPLSSLANKKAFLESLDSLTANGGTRMGKGMLCAKEQLLDIPRETAKRVLILTDGETFDEAECEALAPKFGESNTPLIMIGIGDEYNEKLLLKLAEASQGRPYHLQKISELSTILEQEVGSSVKEVVTGLEANISTVKGVKLDSITRVYPSLSLMDLAKEKFYLGNVVAGDYTVFILEFTVSDIERPPSQVRIAQVGLVGYAPGLQQREEFPVQNLFVEFTTDESEIAQVDQEVLGYVQQKNLDRMIQSTVLQAKTDPQQAKKTLQVAQNMTKTLGNVAVTKMLDNALDELNKTGTISANTAKTISMGGRTKTIKTQMTQLNDVPPQEDIRKITGT